MHEEEASCQVIREEEQPGCRELWFSAAGTGRKERKKDGKCGGMVAVEMTVGGAHLAFYMKGPSSLFSC